MFAYPFFGVRDGNQDRGDIEHRHRVGPTKVGQNANRIGVFAVGNNSDCARIAHATHRTKARAYERVRTLWVSYIRRRLR